MKHFSTLSFLIVTMIGLGRFVACQASQQVPTARNRAFNRLGRAMKTRTSSSTTSTTAASNTAKVTPPASATPAVTKAVAVESSALSKLWEFPVKHPFTFQLIVATTKTAGADLMVQMVAEGKSLSEVDWRRNGIFVVFGFAYLGGFQWWLMVTKYRQWFPTMDKFAKMSLVEKIQWRPGMLDAAKMVLFDLFVHLPFLYFPTYYTVKEFVGGESWNPAHWVQDGVGKYVGNLQEDLTAMVQLWGPSDCVQFMLPIHIRMPFRHLVSFFWTAYVSFTRGAIKAQVPVVE